jgi:phospholipid/cholesterol/gamma-HCH transport system substrate-binding protein
MSSRLEWKVGLFVAVGLALLAALILQFSKGLSLFKPTYEIFLRSESASGLKQNSNVMMAGVPVGSVKEIALSPYGSNVVLTLRIRKTFPIHKDARFSIEQSGFLGDMYVAVTPTENKAPYFQTGDTAVTQKPFNIQEFLGSSGDLVERLQGVVGRLDSAVADFQKLLLNTETMTNLSVTIANARQISARALSTVGHLDELIETNREPIQLTVSNLVSFSARMSDLSANLQELVFTNREGIHSSVKNIESSTEVLKSLLDDVKAGKGLAGALVKDDQIARDVAQVAQNLSITTSNLNRRGLWGILWRQKPAKTNAPEPVGPLTTPKDRAQ